MQIARLFETVYLLLEKRSITARDLSDHFEVSIRTIYRDIDVLSQAGIPIYTSKGRGGGIALMDHYVLNKSLLTKEEQENILTSLSSIQLMQHGQSDKIIQKLGSIFQKTPLDWMEVDFHDWSLHGQQEKFEIIKEAIFTSKILTFHYHTTQGDDSMRLIEPLKLIFKGQSWYVFAYCQTRAEGRFFKLSRMHELSKLDKSFVRRDIAMDIHSYQTVEEPFPITLKINKNMAFRVYDEFHIEECTTKGEYIYVNTAIPNQDWIIHSLLSYGDQLEILAPESLRQTLKKTIHNMHNLYE